jgi:hypothetical protein
MKKVFPLMTLMSLLICLLASDLAFAKKRRRKNFAPPTAQDVYDFSFPRFESKCSFKGLDFSVQIRGKASQASKDESNLGSAFFFILSGKKIAVSPGADSNLNLLPSPKVEGSLCEDMTAVEFSPGRVLFVVKESKSSDFSQWLGVVWDTKSNKIVDHKKDLSKFKGLSMNSTTNLYEISK